MHAVASNHTDVIQEAGWQFEFEIRESALIKLQQQLQEDVPAPPVGPEVRFFCHLYTKCIILPRQARDKHRESTRKRASGLSFVRQFRLQTRHNLPLSDETWVVCQHRLGSNKIPKKMLTEHSSSSSSVASGRASGCSRCCEKRGQNRLAATRASYGSVQPHPRR
eukprot:COSAG06_NODE_3314_length_5520_cov_6.952038_2_plen_165_part_00